MLTAVNSGDASMTDATIASKTDDHDVFVEYRNRTHIHPSNAEEAQVRGVVTSIKERAKYDGHLQFGDRWSV